MVYEWVEKGYLLSKKFHFIKIKVIVIIIKSDHNETINMINNNNNHFAGWRNVRNTFLKKAETN